jgi:hypothetical protein
MTVDVLRIRLDDTDPQGWRERWQQARQQGDSRKMATIVQQVNRLLTDLENRSAREAGDEFDV